MALKTYNPTSPGRRALVLVDRSELHKGRPEKSLTEGLTKSGGRGQGGRIAVRFRGGGVKTLYRKIDFKRRKRHIGWRPHVRGVAMNPIDHPHGGGEGRTSGGRTPVTPWGKDTKGTRTRKNKATDKYIIRTRHVKKAR